MKSLGKLMVSIAFASAIASAMAAPPTAKSLLKDASAKATKSHKNVMVIFHASWCGWCHKLDDFLATPTGKKVENGLEIVHVTVLENGPKKASENAGGEDLMKSLGGENAGLPFFAIVDPNGKLIIDSKAGAKPQNIGYPGEPQEVAHFMKMLEKGAPLISAADRAEINKWLIDHKP